MEVFLYLLPLVGFFAATALLIHAIFWGMTFTVDEAFVRVRFYGWSARKVALSDIEWAAQDWSVWNEHWTNSVDPKRIVLLRRRTGAFRDFLISPPSPPEFLKELAAKGVTVR
ncbi:MAG: hypothetical protein EBR83_07485 [Verrucomicrobia bacterium]|nr:hypothetical protein [Verrucomicrobiota bacterium]